MKLMKVYADAPQLKPQTSKRGNPATAPKEGLNVDNVDLQACWDEGRRMAKDKLVKMPSLQVTRLVDVGVSMLAPVGTPLKRTVEDFEEAEVRA